MTCDRCDHGCFLFAECTREERLPFRNFDKFFGTPERAAASLADANGICKAFNYWADNDGALLCAITPKRGNGKKKKQAEVFLIWLQEECDD